MERIDGYLTRLIQAYLPAATIKVQQEQALESWFIERGEQDQVIGIGKSFKEAKAAILCVITAIVERRKAGVPEDKLLQWGKR